MATDLSSATPKQLEAGIKKHRNARDKAFADLALAHAKGNEKAIGEQGAALVEAHEELCCHRHALAEASKAKEPAGAETG